MSRLRKAGVDDRNARLLLAPRRRRPPNGSRRPSGAAWAACSRSSPALHLSASVLLFGARRPQQPSARQRHGLRRRSRHHGLHARHAARLRRRPHRGDRQHDPQADDRRPAAAERRLLLLPRPLVDRVRCSRSSSPLGIRGLERRGLRRQLRSCTRPPASSARACPASSCCSSACSTCWCSSASSRCSAQMRHGEFDEQRARGPAQQPRLHEPLLLDGHQRHQEALADVPARTAVRARLRHRDRDRAARDSRRRGGRRASLVRDPVPADPVRRRHVAARHDRRRVHELRLRLGVLQAGPQGLLQHHHHGTVCRGRAHHRRWSS